MNIHEYQAKEILTKYGVETPKGGIAYSPETVSYTHLTLPTIYSV